MDQLAEVDARFIDLQVDRGLRRQIAHEQNWKTLARHLVHGAERQTVAVSEGQSLVHPRPVRQACRVQLARRQHDLTQRAVDAISIVVDRHEIVVGADLLDLTERFEQRLVIPEPDVLERRRVVGDVVARQQRIARERPHLDGFETEGAPRRRDVVLDERRLPHLLVGRDDEPLQHGAVDLAPDRDDEVERRRRRGIGQLRVSKACHTASAAPTSATTIRSNAAGMRPYTSA